MAKWEDFKASKEYKLWENIRNICDDLQLRSENDVLKVEDLNEYWEPLLERLFKLGVFFKQTGKLKEIKIDWIRPIFYIKTEYVLNIDGKKYEPDREALANGHELGRNFRYLIASILEFDKLEPTTFKKTKQLFQKASSDFFKSLIKFALKKGFRHLKANIKEILGPLLELRKANYHLFMLESKEMHDAEIALFQDRKEIGEFVKKIQEHFQNEEYKMKRDAPDMDRFEQYLRKNERSVDFQYTYNYKKKEENTGSVEPFKFRKEALQKKFEEGMDKMLKYLYDKKREEFDFPIDIHKLFRNIDLLGNNQLQCVKYYIDKEQAHLREMKIKLYELKINGLSRVKMPITRNEELIDVIKKLYDKHREVEFLMGDKLRYDQFVFFYNCIKFIFDSSMKDELVTIRNRAFMEDAIPKFIILTAMRQAAIILEQMRLKSKKEGILFKWDDYFQVEKMVLDSEYDIFINAYEVSEPVKKIFDSNTELKSIIQSLESEIKEFGGRFWILEGFFPVEDRKLWLEGIEILRNINPLVIDDIRDFILANYEDPQKKDTLLSDRKSKHNESGISRGRRESKNNKMPLVQQKSIKGQSRIRASSSKGKRNTKHHDRSFDSDDESVLLHRQKIPVKLEHLRPPYVWNYPIDIHKKKHDHHEEKRYEIRNIDPSKIYKDGRVKSFLDILNNIKINLMDFCVEKKANFWKMFFERTIAIWSINYNFSTRKASTLIKKDESRSGMEDSNLIII